MFTKALLLLYIYMYLNELNGGAQKGLACMACMGGILATVSQMKHQGYSY